MENKYRTDVIRLKTKHIWLVSHAFWFFFSLYFVGCATASNILVYGHEMIFLIAKHFKYFSIAFHWSLESNLLLLINDLTLCCEWWLASNVCYIPNSKLTVLLSTDYGPRLTCRSLSKIMTIHIFASQPVAPTGFVFCTHFSTCQLNEKKKHTHTFFLLLLAHDRALHRNHRIGSEKNILSNVNQQAKWCEK